MIMKVFNGQIFSGERAQYFANGIRYEKCTFQEGESPLKHSKDIEVEGGTFVWKYPLWNAENVFVNNSVFHEMAKSGLWYTKNIHIENSLIEAPKEFRRSDDTFLKNVEFKNAAETLWTCKGVRLENVKAKGDYFAMNSSEFYADNFELDGNYFLDGGKNIEIHNSKLISKDAFWNCENVTVYDSYINGEYLGWYSKNLKFVNCTIESDQGLCYIDGLTMENCTLINTTLAFEYSTDVNATITSSIVSVKNPGSGKISAPEIGTLIMNPLRVDVSKSEIICDKIGEKYTEDPNLNERA